MNIYDETDKKMKENFKNKEKEIGTAARSIKTDAELEEAIKTKEFTELYIDKSLFKRLGNQDLKKFNKKHLSFVVVETEPTFREKLKVDVGKVNRISGLEEYNEQIATNVYYAILNTEPRNGKEKQRQEELLKKVNRLIHSDCLNLDDKER
jgi:hypothetical protein